MALSDDEGGIVPDCVTNYYLVDSEENLISISSLPLRYGEDEGDEHGELSEPVFLRGTVKDGCGVIYTKVIAWKFVLSYVLPEIYVLGEFGRWMKLHKPRKVYDSTVRSALISVHCLHFMKKNSDEIFREELWKHLEKTFGSFEDPPSENDLADHLQLIKGTALRDRDIAKAKNLHAFLSQIPEKRKAFCEMVELIRPEHEIDMAVLEQKIEDMQTELQAQMDAQLEVRLLAHKPAREKALQQWYEQIYQQVYKEWEQEHHQRYEAWLQGHQQKQRYEDWEEGHQEWERRHRYVYAEWELRRQHLYEEWEHNYQQMWRSDANVTSSANYEDNSNSSTCSSPVS